MQGDGIDVRKAGVIQIVLRGLPQFLKRLVQALLPNQHQSECVVKTRVARRCVDSTAQHTLPVGITLETAVEIGKVDGGGGELWVKPDRRPELHLGIVNQSPLRIEIAQCRARFGAVSIELLGRDEFGRRPLE